MKINALAFPILFAVGQAPLLSPTVAAGGLPGATVTGAESAQGRSQGRLTASAQPVQRVPVNFNP